MESNKFSVEVVADQTKEYRNGEVHIPYGEYKLKFLNKNDRRAVVKIYVDGENVSGGGYILDQYKEVCIERYADSPKRFKFVELDSYEAGREGKDRSNKNKDMGLVECMFYLEKVIRQPQYPVGGFDPYIYPRPWIHPWEYNPYIKYCSIGGQHCNTSKEEKTSGGISLNRGAEGATVHGGHSNQTFRTMHIDLEENFTMVMLTLKGYHTQCSCHCHGHNSKV